MAKRFLTAVAAAAVTIAAAGLTYAQTPPSTDRPKGTAAQTSASPQMDKGGMKGKTRKATKSKKATTKRTARRGGMSGGMSGGQKKSQDDNWWNWNDNKKGNRW